MDHIRSIFSWRSRSTQTREISAFLPLGFHGDQYLLAFVHEIAQQSAIFIETGVQCRLYIGLYGAQHIRK